MILTRTMMGFFPPKPNQVVFLPKPKTLNKQDAPLTIYFLIPNFPNFISLLLLIYHLCLNLTKLWQ